MFWLGRASILGARQNTWDNITRHTKAQGPLFRRACAEIHHSYRKYIPAGSDTLIVVVFVVVAVIVVAAARLYRLLHLIVFVVIVLSRGLRPSARDGLWGSALFRPAFPFFLACRALRSAIRSIDALGEVT